MPLPKLEVPKFDVTLPSNGKKISLRPYLVKEQTVLLMAQFSDQEQDILSAIKQIIGACLMTPDVDVDTFPVFDLEYVFLKLRSKSVGENIDLSYSCTKMTDNVKCGGVFKHEFNVDELAVTVPPKSNVVSLTDTVGITLRYPTYEVIHKYSKFFNPDSGTTNNVEVIFDVIRECTESIYDQDNVYTDFTEEEFMDFVKDLTGDQFTKIVNFFENIPKLEYKIDFVCPKCGSKDNIILSSLMDFFG